MRHDVGVQHISPPQRRRFDGGLRAIVPHFPQNRYSGDVPELSRLLGQEPGLIVASAVVAPEAHRHKGDGVKAAGELLRRCLSQIPGKDLGPLGMVMEFEGVDALADHGLIAQSHGAGEALHHPQLTAAGGEGKGGAAGGTQAVVFMSYRWAARMLRR